MPPIWIHDGVSMDCGSERLVPGRAFSASAFVGDMGKRCVVIEVDTSLADLRVFPVFEHAIVCNGNPNRLAMDKRPEFTRRANLAWMQRRWIEPCWVDFGNPIRNACLERFTGAFREEGLSQQVFPTVASVHPLNEGWPVDYNSIRPNSALGGLARRMSAILWSRGWPHSSDTDAPMCRSSEGLQMSKSPRLTQLVEQHRGRASSRCRVGIHLRHGRRSCTSSP